MTGRAPDQIGAVHFICLDPRKAKRAKIAQVLGRVGPIRWVKLPPFSLRATAAAKQAAQTAMRMSKNRGWSGLRKWVNGWLLARQYAGTYALFRANPQAVAVCWNGLNGGRRVFMQAAKDAGARCLFFELAPLPDRITMDPKGVNFHNALPRDTAPYLHWGAQAREAENTWHGLRDHITQRPSDQARAAAGDLPPLGDPFVFVALQTPGDSQLRLFGGAFPTVEGFVAACIEAAHHLPDGWHMRIKEHPTAPTDLAAAFAAKGDARVFLDNDTNTFDQVRAARAVATVNSSVGLEAMMFEKPVIACGQAFWAIDGIATQATDQAALNAACAAADRLAFDARARSCFLDYIDQIYYPRLDAPPEQVVARLQGRDAHGFWEV
ncbi:capsular biosynthesis protein [Octadecabacter sp. G9-8]|uniref:Capsular biosynthesis protein n=1 Tax=Octadecabacter dasysiphoniae TaxID=2909341 RepID=A0ABS9CYV0_9RHOB|nr:capsular biosynthesis protein [Octadecabacter dasysiphoniae]MCF2872465.1 capsular biosynthesis protein [Octadecabacter dasysiphoniae]